MPGAGTGVDEIQQVLGVGALFRGVVHESFLWRVTIGCMVTESLGIAAPCQVIRYQGGNSAIIPAMLGFPSTCS
jgi:hypothetical protein